MSTATGVKLDADKVRLDLLPVQPVMDVARVLTFGAKKYAPNNWQLVPEGRDRYYAAALRHLFAWRAGEKNDPESGLPHLAHAACCVLFAMWMDEQP